MSALTKYRKNLYSQFGEDGVIKEICSRLQISSGSFVEFGAWDGKHFSNTYHLLQQGWGGVYIEGDKTRFHALVQNMHEFEDRVTLINAYVEARGDRSLDRLLSTTELSRDFELLIIDIDSYDWQVWQSLENYRPIILIIEINSSIPVGIFQTHRNNQVQGSSFTATVELGKEKGYTPVCHTGNVIFVRNDRLEDLRLPPEELRYPELLFDYGWKQLSFEDPLPQPFKKIAKIYSRLRKLLDPFVKRFGHPRKGSLR
jgi:hypothetical protein